MDISKEKFDNLRSEWDGREQEIDTEADVRFQIINRILTEILGWPYSDVQNEPHTDSGYIDYLAHASSDSKLVVEAKRTNKKLIDTAETRFRWYKLGGAAVASAADGIEQAKNYCVDEAAMFAAVTNGYQWIGFWALRTDGIPLLDGRAAVFPTLDSISKNFAVFYDLFSCIGMKERLFQIHVHEAEGLRIAHGEPLNAAIPANSIQMLPKSPLAADIEKVFRRFFSEISREDDLEMLARCFVDSRESREADDSLNKIVREVLNSIEEFGEGTRSLEHEIRSAVDTNRGELVLIVGNKGAGKSTFIDRFFRISLDASLRKKCFALRLNLADSSGELSTITTWLTDQLLEQLESQLFKDGLPTYEQLQGVFMKEYDRWRRAEHKFLYERNKEEFKERFGDWMYNCRQTDSTRYVRDLLKSVVHQRKMMPCIVFDNTDHFPQEFQEAVYQYAQSLFRMVFSFIICPITDRTIWQLSKAGPMQSYANKTFYLPVPSSKDVISKRITFLKEKIDESGDSQRYFLDQGITLKIEHINNFAVCVEDFILKQDYIARIISWLSNHDIRRSLKITERMITSPVLKVSDFIKANLGIRSTAPRPREIKLGLIRGDYTHFLAGQNDFILNVFEVNEREITSPLIRMSILRLLKDNDSENQDPSNAYMSTREIVNYLEPMGYPINPIKNHLRMLFEYRLIIPYDLTDEIIYDELRLRIAPAGRIHYELAFAHQEGSYLSEMALTTPIRDLRTREFITEKLDGRMNYEGWVRIQAAFVDYCLTEDNIHTKIPANAMYESQRLMREELRGTWKVGEYPMGQQDLNLA